MTDRKELVRKALAEKTLLKLMHEQHDRTRAELAEHFTDPGEREVGMLLDHRLGTVELRAGRESWSVVDEDAFLRWMSSEFPHEIVHTRYVRPAARDAILARCRRDGGILDDETGAVEIPPGVVQRKGEPTLYEIPEKQAGFVIEQWAAGTRLGEVLGIEAS